MNNNWLSVLVFKMDFTIEVSSPWFEHIRNGNKTVEGRKGTPRWSLIQPGMLGSIINPITKDEFHVKCTDVKKYTSLQEYLETETVEKALPGVTTIQDVISIYLQWSTLEEISRYGFLGIHLTLI